MPARVKDRKPRAMQVVLTFDEPLYVAFEKYERQLAERLGADDLMPTRAAILRSLLRRGMKEKS